MSSNILRFFIAFLFLVSAQLKGQQLDSISIKTKKMMAYEGFQTFYWDESTGKIWLQIDKFDEEFLYQTSLPAGLGSNDIGLDRGKLGTTYILKFKRIGNKVLLIEPNYAYRALTESPSEKRAVEQSFAQSTIWGFNVGAESDGSVLVDATSFLLRDALQISAQLQQSQQGAYAIDDSRSAIYLERTKNFPLNSELEATITFVNKDGKPGNYVREVSPQSDAITLRIHHSFVKLPDEQYEPRLNDVRSSFINNSFFDYSTPVSEPIQKNFIIRHRLKKKNPEAVRSEAIKPIVYYLDNGTPEPIRSALLEGAKWWNQAFEAAGFINAFQVEILPEDADPMDLRYNMINWVHRSTRGWSYGYAVVDPRTGEILKGNVSLGSLRVRQDYLIAQGLLSPFDNDSIQTDERLMKMALQRLKQLAAHEIGHTIGIMHNYISSTQNRASVMDYPPPMAVINAKDEIDLSDAYTNEIGDWDKVSIQYGYSQFPKGSDEKAQLDKILDDAAKKGLTFISDRDSRDPGGLHPHAHLWDTGSDPISELTRVMKVRDKALSKFGANSIRNGTPMAMLEDVLVPIYLFHRYQVEAVAKIVGGQYYSYAIKGDDQMITKPVTKAEQVNALKAVLSSTDPKTLAINEGITKLIPPRPAYLSYNRELFPRKTGLAFDPLSAAESATIIPFSFLFNTSRLNRLAEYESHPGSLGLSEMLKITLDHLFEMPKSNGLQELIRLQNQQILLTYLLSVSTNDQASYATKAAVLATIETLKKNMTIRLKKTKDNTEKGYLLLSLERIKSPEKAKVAIASTIPPGAPIGCGMGEE